MNNIAFFNGSLVSFLGESIRTCKSNEDLGLSEDDTRFISDSKGNSKGFMRIVGNFDATKCSKVMSVQEANAKMLEIIGDNRYSYVETNATVVNTLLTKALNDGTIKASELLNTWTPNQLNEFLFNKGIAGISKIDNYTPFAE